MALSPLYHTSPRGQCAVMLIAALHEMYVKDSIGNASKRDTIQFIARHHWFDIHDEDRDPYQSQNQIAGEPRWHTMIAWARKDGVIRDLVSYEARDTWGMTNHGRAVFERYRKLCANGERPVAACYLWSPKFKKHMNPAYEPGPTDATRPPYFYRDTQLIGLIKLIG